MLKMKFQLWVEDESNVWKLIGFFSKQEEAIEAYDEMKEKAEEAGDSGIYQYELVQVVSVASGY
jgi:hypothetical protein